MKKILFTITFALICSAALAATPPVEISAQKSLEWNRKDKTYTAREKVVVVQGDVRLHCDMLTARYTDDKGITNVSTLEAQSNILIQSPPYTATGDKAVYNVTTGNAVLTGKDLRITTADDVVTAHDKIEFFSRENRLTAHGGATATRGPDVMTADTMNAYFSQNKEGKLGTDKITALGNVTIKTQKETVTGDEGVYDIAAQKAALTGKVRIRQGENWVEGTRANIDMKTGISQLLGGGNGDGRVRGVFYPQALKQEGQ